jgi:cysteinyl-tRNA synthetase
MSKSLGNFLTIREMIKRYHPEVVRHFLLSAHYRSPVDFTEDALAESEKALERFYTAVREARAAAAQGAGGKGQGEREVKQSSSPAVQLSSLDLKEQFISAMDDDFNTALAIGHVYDAVRELNKLASEVRSPKPEVKEKKLPSPLVGEGGGEGDGSTSSP